MQSLSSREDQAGLAASNGQHATVTTAAALRGRGDVAVAGSLSARPVDVCRKRPRTGP